VFFRSIPIQFVAVAPRAEANGGEPTRPGEERG
jgi:hypothetical protein